MDGAALAQIPLFAEMTEDERDAFAEVCVEMDVETGEPVVTEGDFGYAMFAIKEGTAEVLQDGEVLRRLGPGDVFGEVAVLFGGRRTATVVATTPMSLVVVMTREVVRLERQAPEVGAELRAKIAYCLGAAPELA